jgi:hypothetical protein
MDVMMGWAYNLRWGKIMWIEISGKETPYLERRRRRI